jgi:hypothetical protein
MGVRRHMVYPSPHGIPRNKDRDHPIVSTDGRRVPCASRHVGLDPDQAGSGG